MNNTPTPKSDKNTYNKHQDNCPTSVVPSLICRQLERELTAAREELAELKEEYGTWWAQKRITIDELKEVTEQRDRLADALTDMLSGWRYIRKTHGDLYGVGWDRAQTKAEQALQSLNPDHTVEPNDMIAANITKP